MSKVRVYEVAKDLGIDNKSLVALFHSIGVTDVRNHMSAVAPEQVERVKRHLEKQSAEKVVEERIRPTVVKRRVKRRVVTGEASSPSAAAAPVPEPARVSTPAARAPSEPAAAPAPKDKPAAKKSEPKAAKAPPRKSEPTPAAEAPAVTEAASAPAVEAKAQQEPETAATEQEAAAKSAPAAAAPEAPQEAPQKAPGAETKPEPAAPPATTRSPAAAEVPDEKKKAEKVARPDTPAPKADKPKTSPPKRGVEVWEGRPGVPMPQTVPRSSSPAPRRVQYDAKAGTAGGVGQRRGPMVGGRMMRGGRRGGGGLGSLSPKRSGGQPVTQERSAHKKVVKIEGTVQLQTLAGKMSIKATELLMKLMQLGMTGVNINSTLDADTAKIVANELGWELEDVAVSEEEQLVEAQSLDSEALAAEEAKRVARAPVVTVMGHVDHGKTSLLDAIRETNVVGGEAGGITQHIGAYSVETPKGRLTFLDTPGHEAFTAMRARGAQTTDVVILVVAADDGVMPQTKEAANHAKAAKVPIVVAVNKIDKEDAQPERARRELSEVGLVPEEWGGDTLFCEVSAVTKQGIDQLLESVVLQAELLDLKANPDKLAQGVVVEAKLDRGRGPVATMLVQDGTLNRGDVILAGSSWGKVRAMIDDRGRNISKAGPSTPVSIVGLSEVPSAGDPVHVLKDQKAAQQIAESRKTKERRSLMPASTKVTLEELARAMSEAAQLELKVIVKADVQGSVEAVAEALQRLSTEKVKVTVVHSAAGAVTEGDVNLASAAEALIIAFNVRPAGKAASLAQQEGVEIRQYGIIYDVVDDVKRAMEGMLEPTKVEKDLGKAEIRQLFKVSKAGWIAGCMVTSGTIARNAYVRIVRDGKVVWDGRLSSLKRFKDDVREVREGFDCGLSFDGFSDMKVGDIVECYDIEEVRQSL